MSAPTRQTPEERLTAFEAMLSAVEAQYADTAAQIDALVVDTVKQAHQRAAELLKANRDKLDKLAAYLLEKETITGEEFMELLKQE